MYSYEDSMTTWKELIAQKGQQVSTAAWDDQCIDWCEQPPRKKAKQQALQSSPHSHKVVEKRRRDRMNQAIGSLSRLIPASYLKQGQSRVEKAEIIELAAQHLLAITSQLRKCEAALGQAFPATEAACCIGKFYQGFRESSKAAMAFLTEQEGYSTTDTLCCRLREHLHDISERHLPSKDELSSDDQHPHLQQAQQRPGIRSESGVSYFTDEGPRAAAAEVSSPGSGVDHATEVTAAAASAAEASSASSTTSSSCRGPKSAFKRRFEIMQAESEAAVVETAAVAEEQEELLLPGFVLHESGTHYLPLVVPPSALGTEVCGAAGLLCGGEDDGDGDGDGGDGGTGDAAERPSAGRAAPPLLHPVSIPVNFRATRFVQLQLGRQQRKKQPIALP